MCILGMWSLKEKMNSGFQQIFVGVFSHFEYGRLQMRGGLGYWNCVGLMMPFPSGFFLPLTRNQVLIKGCLCLFLEFNPKHTFSWKSWRFGRVHLVLFFYIHARMVKIWYLLKLSVIIIFWLHITKSPCLDSVKKLLILLLNWWVLFTFSVGPFGGW